MFKNSKLVSFPFMLVTMACVVGCGGSVDISSQDDADDRGKSASLGTGDPATDSIISHNSLEPEALVPTDLGENPLVIEKMSLSTADALTGPDGKLLRRLLKYAIACALGPQDHFAFSWVDSGGALHEEVYVGDTGLAQGWLEQPLSSVERQWVSACLAARTNWYAEPVKIAMHGSAPQLAQTSDESVDFTHREGAFWGDLFSTKPFLRSCFVDENMVHSRTKRRECAAGHLEIDGTVVECGMIEITGSCSEVCDPLIGKDYYPACSLDGVSPDVQSPFVITVFLD